MVDVRLGRLGRRVPGPRRYVPNGPLLEFDIVFPLVPAAVGVAILKYRLYDIERLISAPWPTRS